MRLATFVVGVTVAASVSGCAGASSRADNRPASTSTSAASPTPASVLVKAAAVHWRLRSVQSQGKTTTMPPALDAWIEFPHGTALLGSDGLNACQAGIRTVGSSGFQATNSITGGEGSRDVNPQSPLNVARTSMQLVLSGEVVSSTDTRTQLSLRVQDSTLLFVNAGPSQPPR